MLSLRTLFFNSRSPEQRHGPETSDWGGTRMRMGRRVDDVNGSDLRTDSNSGLPSSKLQIDRLILILQRLGLLFIQWGGTNKTNYNRMWGARRHCDQIWQDVDITSFAAEDSIQARCYAQRAHISQHPRHSFASKKLGAHIYIIYCHIVFPKILQPHNGVQRDPICFRKSTCF